MNITTIQENLQQGLLLVSRVTTKNVNLPILQNVLIRTHDKVLRLSTTNLEIAMSCLIRGKVSGEGEFTVPARLFAEYVSLLPPGNVNLELSGNDLLVKSQNAETKIHGIPATEFPIIPRVNEGVIYEAPREPLVRGLNSVLFAVAQTESRPELTGVNFSFEEASNSRSTLTLAATDSYRLAEAVIPFSKKQPPQPRKLIIPARTLTELSRMISNPMDITDGSDQVTITISQNQIQFEYGTSELQSRIIEGSYPDYQQIIPQQFRTEAILPRTDFISAIKTASLFTRSGLADVRLEFSPGKPVSLAATDSQTGEHHAEVSGVVTGDENHVVINYRYLLDGLQAIEDEEIILRLIDASNPCLVTPKNPEEKYRYLIMPIKQ